MGEPSKVTSNILGSKDMEPTCSKDVPLSLVTSIPLKKEASVLKSVPQEKSPVEFHWSLPVVVSQAANPEPKSLDEEEYDVFSNGREKEAPVEVKRYRSVPISKLEETEALVN